MTVVKSENLEFGRAVYLTDRELRAIVNVIEGSGYYIAGSELESTIDSLVSQRPGLFEGQTITPPYETLEASLRHQNV